ncbi:MAG: alginate lyase family protein [Proteobacteria bacterium]|nr:alginate lyase family protein [Pseudomonadota bacterium]
MKLRDTWQELRELGLFGSAYRVAWELRRRSGYFAWRDRSGGEQARALPERAAALQRGVARIGLGDPAAASEVVRSLGSEPARLGLQRYAEEAAHGRILCFGRWLGDYGDPVDWQRDPTTGRRWPADLHWSRALAAPTAVGDIKLVWEVGRFPQAYLLARAALQYEPGHPLRAQLVAALARQITDFIAANPPAQGAHWASGQELVFRLMAWSFALHALPELRRGLDAVALSSALRAHVQHVARYLEYARYAVSNNHLLSEACGLLLGASLLADDPEAASWWQRGSALLDEQAERQFYPDGGYLQQSHNYQRVALQVLLWACALAEGAGRRPAASWLRALARSVDFLCAQQQSSDGRLPNFGANDGALPSPLSLCDYSDFRPTLQAAQLRARGERLYPAGPWDEEAVWLVGATRLADAPLRPPARRSRSFAIAGQHVLRDAAGEALCVLRCGTLRDRFAQIDMLHLDLWWRGHNVLVDGGSYLYNGPVQWHRHFVGSASHNTVVVDGRDQMVHHRRFKLLYPAKARLLRWRDHGSYALMAGEHEGYTRYAGACVHRRCVLWLKGQGWIVVDELRGTGEHELRLHWLAGPFPWRAEQAAGAVALETPAGELELRVLDGAGAARTIAVTAGQADPPLGWLSRYYGEKTPTPAIVARCRGTLPQTFVTLIGPRVAAPQVDAAQRWCVRLDQAAPPLTFGLREGLIEAVGLGAG